MYPANIGVSLGRGAGIRRDIRGLRNAADTSAVNADRFIQSGDPHRLDLLDYD